MIDKRELIDAASRMSLNPHVVEKDFALSWILAGIYAHEALADSWVFKGGTCLKKCFFETYRFSEDLDFTLTNEDHLNADFLNQIFAEVAEWVYENSGIEMPADQQRFDVFTNPRGSISCQGKLPYIGPISPRSGGIPRIKLDLTCDERVVMAPVQSQVFHPYSDEPSGKIYALSYSYEEVFAEKFRALAERTRPRDLYDVVNLFRNDQARPSPSVLRYVLQQKCDFKGIELPTLADLEPHFDELSGAWQPMLTHQLPALPELDAFMQELPAIFEWLESGIEPHIPAALAISEGDVVVREREFSFNLSGAGKSNIEIIRFAAANRLCVDLNYTKLNGEVTTPRIEPYSLRRSQNGDVLLHGFDVNKFGNRSYRIERINAAQVSNESFSPRFEIELTPEGPVRVGSKATGSGISRARPVRRRLAHRSAAAYAAPTGPVYVYQCPVCQKKFQRKKQNNKLNRHKNKWGGPCGGQTGSLLEMKY